MARGMGFLPPVIDRAGQQPLRGIERLMLAMVGTMLDDLRGASEPRRLDAREYLMSEDRTEILSFVSICTHFGWSVDRVRDEIGRDLAGPCGGRWRSY